MIPTAYTIGQGQLFSSDYILLRFHDQFFADNCYTYQSGKKLLSAWRRVTGSRDDEFGRKRVTIRFQSDSKLGTTKKKK